MSFEAMDPYIAAQIAARETQSVIKIKLLNIRSLYPEGLIVAIEGADDKPVYSRWLSRAAPELLYEIMECGGKRPARQLGNSLAKDVSGLSRDVKIIVDRDFDDLTGFLDTTNVFMLDKYSIENFLVNSHVLERALATAYPCNGFPQVRRNICDLFESDFSKFLLATKGINERIFIARRLNIDIENKIPTSIDVAVHIGIGTTKFVAHDPSIIIPYDLDGHVEIVEILKEFLSLDPASRYRGKFAWKFFTKWLERLAAEFRNPEIGVFASVPERGRINQSELALGALASHCPLPDGLGTFLNS